MTNAPTNGNLIVTEKAIDAADGAISLVRRVPAPLKPLADQVIRSAASVFAEKGFHGASTKDIAERMGIKQGSLYYYFKSKEEALEEVCLFGIQDYVERMDEIIEHQLQRAAVAGRPGRPRMGEPFDESAGIAPGPVDDVERRTMVDLLGRAGEAHDRVVAGHLDGPVVGEHRVGERSQPGNPSAKRSATLAPTASTIASRSSRPNGSRQRLHRRVTRASSAPRRSTPRSPRRATR